MRPYYWARLSLDRAFLTFTFDPRSLGLASHTSVPLPIALTRPSLLTWFLFMVPSLRLPPFHRSTEMSVPCSTRSCSRLPRPRLKSRTRATHQSQQQLLRPLLQRGPGPARDAVHPAANAAISAATSSLGHSGQ